MITEGEAAIPKETTLHAFRDQEKTKQRTTIAKYVAQTDNCRTCNRNPTYLSRYRDNRDF